MQKRTGDTIAVDWSMVESRHSIPGDGWEDSFGGFTLGEIPLCSYEKSASQIQKNVLRINKRITYHQFLHVFLPIVKFVSQFFGIYTCLDSRYFPYCYFGVKQKIVLGYFECDRYFNDVEEDLQRLYQPIREPLQKNREMLEKIKSTQSVCVTIRRGDFFTSKNVRTYGLCDQAFFLRGIEYIRSKYPDAVLFFFSDEIEWVKKNMNVACEAYYESGDDPLWEKLRLMSACKHFVISNSTFSWWAQHLSQNPNKIVVAPRLWRANDKSYDIRQANWTLR